ncbi:hypothetical protein TRVA0_006S03818 [Trichomonascus vanleenenianus]|uniref:uncharacterized protein n=1 Tax=Trichomonascus vanleenenianus TaxID=2268995 RepID=UPI003ECAE33F
MNSFNDPWQTPNPSADPSATASPTAASFRTASPALDESTPRLKDLIPAAKDYEEDEDVLEADVISEEDKTGALRTILVTAASNGDVERVTELLHGGSSTRKYLDVNAKDESGSTALIYSSCFGHEAIVSELLEYGASVDEQDGHEWTALMWAINNHHTSIVKVLVDYNANVGFKTSTGRSALDFVTKHSDIYVYLKSKGYIEEETGDFYNEAHDPEAQLETELSKQIMVESAYNLDVDMAHLDLGDRFAVEEEEDDDSVGFVWERCLPDQMFVFNESDIPKILDEAITKMEPKRSPTQKPIPANVIFLSARYAHYYGSAEMVENFLDPAISRIGSVCKQHKEDIAFLAFWMSNCTLLMYYIRKDTKLFESTFEFQHRLSELITDIYVMITQDVERRLDRILDSSILDFETIPGLNNIVYQKEWKLFKPKHKQLTQREEIEQTINPPTMEQKAKPAPRNVTSILSSVLFVMDLYEVHPIIVQQVIGQLFYWIGAVLFNRVISNRKYLARSRAMQVRLNVSAIEDWARQNNRRPENSDEFQKEPSYPSISEICRLHFSPVVQMLQWLQCFTGFGEDFTNVVATLQQLTELNPYQLLHVANLYRAEVGEKGLSKEYKNYLSHLNSRYKEQFTHKATVDMPPENNSSEKENGGEKKEGEKEKKEELKEVEPTPETSVLQSTIERRYHGDEDEPELYLDASVVLPFVIPTLREMIVFWGAGLGGTHKSRARKHEPFLPADFLDKFEDTGAQQVADSVFKDVTMPQPSMHKGWGEDPEIDEMANVW